MSVRSRTKWLSVQISFCSQLTSWVVWEDLFTTNFTISHKKLVATCWHHEVNVKLGTQNAAKMFNLADTTILCFVMSESISKIYFHRTLHLHNLATCARKATFPGSGQAASYVQRWALCCNRPNMSKCLISGWKW